MEQLIMRWENDGIDVSLDIPDNITYKRLSEIENGIEIWCHIMEYGLSKGNEGENYYYDAMKPYKYYTPDSCFIILYKNNPCASITVICDPEHKDGYIHMVACMSDFRGLGIGSFMNKLAVWELKRMKMKTAHLTTDDWRIPAIRSYLRCGFQPDESTEERKSRWDAVRSHLMDKTEYMKITNAKIVLYDRVITGTVTICGDTIAEISEDISSDGIDIGGKYLAPGFVDIHSHGGGDSWFFDEPEKAARWHLERGTTSMLASMWRNAGTYSYEKAINNVKNAMNDNSNIRGIHLEGPYVDPDLGSEGGNPWPIDESEYLNLIKIADGTIKTWTFDPMQDGAKKFAETAFNSGIKLGVCYSKASPEVLEEYLDKGLRLGSHIFCATGAPETMFVGTKEPGSDVFVLCRDEMTAEVIADSLGGHVRAYNLKLIYKCKTSEKIALVSDFCPGGETMDSDVNIINGELYGSRLSLSVAIKNMRKHTGADIVELMRMASTTPARAIGMWDRGEIGISKKADFVILDENLNVCDVMLNGKNI